MSQSAFGKFSRFLSDVKQKSSDAIQRQQVALVRGKVAGTDVLDSHGEMIVGAGHTIDDAVIERAIELDKLTAVVVAVGTGRMQDIREKVHDQIDRSEGGREAQMVGSVEDYMRARHFVGHFIGIDITDIRGKVILGAGTKLTENDVRTAREHNLLEALIYAGKQPWIPPTQTEPSDFNPTQNIKAGSRPMDSSPAPAAVRAKLPLVTPVANPKI